MSWWRHQMETFSALLAICAGNSPVPGEFPTQRPVTRSFDVFFDLRLNKPLSKQSWGWWFETLSRPLWRHPNVMSFRTVPHYVLPYPVLSCHVMSYHIYQTCVYMTMINFTMSSLSGYVFRIHIRLKMFVFDIGNRGCDVSKYKSLFGHMSKYSTIHIILISRMFGYVRVSTTRHSKGVLKALNKKSLKMSMLGSSVNALHALYECKCALLLYGLCIKRHFTYVWK